VRIKVDQARCVSAGQCAATTLELFDQRDSDGVVILRQEVPPKDLEDKARLAASLCPSQAITIEE